MNPKAAWAAALVAALHGPPDQPPAATTDPGTVDFDGGPRDPAPATSDPEADHSKTVLAALRDLNNGTGGDW